VKTHLELSTLQKELERRVQERTAQLREAHRQLEFKVRELEGRDRLVHLHMKMTSASLHKAYEEILLVVEMVLEVEKAVIYRPDSAEMHLEMKAALGLSEPGGLQQEAQLAPREKIAIDDAPSPVARTFADKRPRRAEEGEAMVPILYGEEPLGGLWVGGLRETEVDPKTMLNTLWNLGREAALVLRIGQINADLADGKIEIDELLAIEE